MRDGPGKGLASRWRSHREFVHFEIRVREERVIRDDLPARLVLNEMMKGHGCSNHSLPLQGEMLLPKANPSLDILG
jgi:hypothetical protein